MIFYGVYIRDPNLSFLFDALRFVAQPDALRRSHITVRGPYERRINIEQFNKTELGALCIRRPGNFFLNHQKTVFLHCEIVGIWDVWNKPDFRDGIVHLTVYDGKSDEESRGIFDLLQGYDWNIWTTPTKLVELEKKVINTESINILEPKFSRSLQNFLETTFDISSIRKLNFIDRKAIMEMILKEIHKKRKF